MTALRSPYPWFGGKSSIARLVWGQFGRVRNFVEPFFGSGAVLLQRPTPFEGSETINDADCMVSNFWRALAADSEAVAKWADWPVNEADLHARHIWLISRAEFRERMKTDPDYFDPKIAGWWVWGLCKWIGSGWCEKRAENWEQLPHLGDAGRGIDRPSQKRPHLGNAGRGIDRPSQKRPHLGNAGRGEIYGYFAALAARLRRVRVCCGDWERVCGPTPTVKQGTTAVFLDPPYSAETGRDRELYSIEDLSVSHRVREWCKERGDDPRIRIALCGYEGEHEELESMGWESVAWKAKGGYASRADHGNPNARKERVWFSPFCVGLRARHPLFAGLES